MAEKTPTPIALINMMEGELAAPLEDLDRKLSDVPEDPDIS